MKPLSNRFSQKTIANSAESASIDSSAVLATFNPEGLWVRFYGVTHNEAARLFGERMFVDGTTMVYTKFADGERIVRHNVTGFRHNVTGVYSVTAVSLR